MNVQGVVNASVIRLVDMRGRVVSEFTQSTPVPQIQIDVQHIETGNYILQIIINDRIVNEKVMIRR